MDQVISFEGLTNLDTSNVTTMSTMFLGLSSLNTLALGISFNFVDGTIESLPSPPAAATYTGRWQNVGAGTLEHPQGSNIWTANEFMSNYNGLTDADTYVWQKAPVAGGDVKVKYQDTDGNKIFSDIIKSGNVGESYTTEQLPLSGYTFKEVQGNASGTFTDQPQTVIYVYMKDTDKATPDNKPNIDEENHDKNTPSSSDHSLPKTGENERMTLMSFSLGLILLAVALVTSVLRLKKGNR